MTLADQDAPACLLLAGLPAAPQAGPAASWEEELNARASCPAHRGRLTASAVRRGALYEPIPADWLEPADLGGLRIPVLKTRARVRLPSRSS